MRAEGLYGGPSFSSSRAPEELRARRTGGGLRWGGLRWRLTAWVAVVMLLFAAVIFVAVYRGTATQLRHQIDTELAGDASEFSHNLQLLGRGSPHTLAAAASRYVHDQPFGASSTLLFASVPGAGTSTNQPELLGQVAPDDGESAAEQGQENRLARRLFTVADGYSTLSLPDVGDLRLLKRRLTIAGRPGVTIGVGEPLASVHRAQHGVARAFILAGALALAAALLASYLIGARVSRPLRRMAAIAARVDAGELEPRIHEAGGPGDEVRVLADAFNHMLDRLSAAFAGQRAFVADASHELRTPLTVIRGQLEVLARPARPPIEEVRRVERLVQAEVSRITRLVDDLLLLAKSEERQFLHVEPIDLRPLVEDLWDGMSLTAERRFELSAIPRARSGPIPTGSPRHCATWPATRSSTPSTRTGSSAWMSNGCERPGALRRGRRRPRHTLRPARAGLRPLPPHRRRARPRLGRSRPRAGDRACDRARPSGRVSAGERPGVGARVDARASGLHRRREDSRAQR